MFKKRLVISLAVISLVCYLTWYSAYSNNTDNYSTSDEDEYNDSVQIESSEDLSSVHVHEFSNATCFDPQICSCGETKGSPLAHNYVDGYCDRCGFKDPDYTDLNTVGFIDNYGMNTWVRVSYYTIGKGSENKVRLKGVGRDPDTEAIKSVSVTLFSINYGAEEDISIDVLKNNSKLPTDLFPYSNAKTFDSISNDFFYIDNRSKKETIVERLVRDDNILIIKTLRESTEGKNKEIWYVPTDLLDFSTIAEDPESSGYVVYFKE